MKRTFDHIKCTTRRYTVSSLIIFSLVLNIAFFVLQVWGEYRDLQPIVLDSGQMIYDHTFAMYESTDDQAVAALARSGVFGLTKLQEGWYIVKQVEDKVLMKSLHLIILKQKILGLATGLGLLFVIIGYLVLLESMQKQITKTISDLLVGIRNLRPETPGQQLTIEGLHCNDELHDIINAVNAKSLQVQAYIDHLKRLIGFIQHEFNTPLTAAILRLERMSSKGPTGDDYAKMRNNLQHLSELVLSLSQLTQLQIADVEKTPVDLISTIEHVVSDLKIKYPKHTIQTLLPNQYVFYANKEFVEMICRNILDNACKYSSHNYPIELIVQNASLIISDKGPGIEASKLAEIRLPFWQADQSRSIDNGFGLGLALVRELCVAMGWSIDCKSKVGVGTSFIIHRSKKDVTTLSDGG